MVDDVAGRGSAAGTSAARPADAAHGEQLRLADLGTPLHEVTFVVVDLETTGGAPADAGITEIGAVKVRGGEVLGRFQTLVNPGSPIPPFVAALTGITDALVATAPPLAAALPMFWEFAGDAVLVAHNAPYDTGFLAAAGTKLGYPWPAPTVLDTARLARVVLHRDEVRNCKLATLAAHFRATVTPTHRALDDALATADVLHALLERAGSLGASTVADVVDLSARVSRAQRTKRHLADGLPDAPGVYVFRDRLGVALYVGTSGSIRTRVRSYFTAAEQRRRMAEMIEIATSVTPIVCATTLEAHVREIRLIVAEQPRYNHRSRRPQAQRWLKLTVEPAPRLAVVAQVADDTSEGARYLGPFGSRGAAQAAAEALLLAHPVRTCTTRLGRRSRQRDAGCALAELGRCLAPCSAAGDREAYAGVVEGLRTAMSGDLREVVALGERRMALLAADERFEDAAAWRERLEQAVSGSVRAHRIAALAGQPELVAARPTPDAGWQIHVVRHGRLAAAGVAAPRTDPRAVIDALVACGEQVAPPPLPAPAALVEETTAVLDWLESGQTRLVRSDGLSWPTHCGGLAATRLAEARRATTTAALADDYRATAAGRSGRPVGPADARPVTRISLAAARQ